MHNFKLQLKTFFISYELRIDIGMKLQPHLDPMPVKLSPSLYVIPIIIIYPTTHPHTLYLSPSLFSTARMIPVSSIGDTSWYRYLTILMLYSHAILAKNCKCDT